MSLISNIGVILLILIINLLYPIYLIIFFSHGTKSLAFSFLYLGPTLFTNLMHTYICGVYVISS